MLFTAIVSAVRNTVDEMCDCSTMLSRQKSHSCTILILRLSELLLALLPHLRKDHRDWDLSLVL